MTEIHWDFNLVVGISSSILNATGVMVNAYFVKGLTTCSRKHSDLGRSKNDKIKYNKDPKRFASKHSID